MSKFSKVLEAAKERGAGPEEKKRGASFSTLRDSTAAQPAGRGRPRGKRSDPNYEQTTAYIRKQTHLGVKIALLKEGKGREYSELVEDLLAEWLKSHV